MESRFPIITKLINNEMERIKRERIPVRDLATKIQISPASLYNYAYNNVTPNDEAIKKIATYFKVTPAYLRGETEGAIVKIGGEKSSVEKIFESSVEGRSAEEKLELMALWLQVVREHDSKKES